MQIIKSDYETMIFTFRAKKVMVDYDLAVLYEVPTKAMKQQVKRNQSRFPEDFMFELSKNEKDELVTICDRLSFLKHSSVNSFINDVLRCQFGTLRHGEHAKYLPYAFTEQGVAMLSSVLNSERAIVANIAIMRAFVQMRKFLETHKDLALKIEELERTVSSHDENIQMIFETIRQMIEKKSEPMEPVGFKIAGGKSGF